ncbi:MAG: tetratricopeptide repeat protein [Elainella sp.]
MKSDLPKPAKWLIPGALILFLVPTFLLALNKEIRLLRETLPSAQQTPAQTDAGDRPLPLISPEMALDGNMADLIDNAVEAEVRENFDLTLSLINLLLGALAVIPILGGVFLWSLQKQIEGKLIDKSEALVNQKIQESEQLAKQKVQELIDTRTAELQTLKIDQILRLINFSIKEAVHPLIKEKYREMFRQAFIEGFPSHSFIDSVNRETRQMLEEYVEIFQSLVGSYPDFFKANDYVWLADACFILTQYSAAKAFYSTANRLNPHSSRILHRLGNGNLALQNYPEALDCYREALRCSDTDSTEFRLERHAWLYHNLGKAHYQLYNYEEAIQNYRKACEFYPKLYHSYYWQGNALSGLGRFVEALDCFKQADQMLQTLQADHQIPEPDFKADRAWVLHSMGDALRKIGDSCHQSSPSGREQCIWFNPNCRQPHRSQQQGQQQGQQHGQQQGQHRQLIPACQQRLDYYRQAIDYYDQAEQLNGSNIETLHKRGKAYRELGKYAQAETDYRRAVQLATAAGTLHDRCNLLANLANLLAHLPEVQPNGKPATRHRAEANQKRQEACEWFAVALEQCQTRRLQARADRTDILEQFYSYFDTARCYSLKGEVKRADEYMKDALAHCPAGKRALVQQWANSDSDFNRWYWHVRAQKS